MHILHNILDDDSALDPNLGWMPISRTYYSKMNGTDCRLRVIVRLYNSNLQEGNSI